MLLSLNKQTNPFSPCEPLIKFKPFIIPGEAISLAHILSNSQIPGNNESVQDKFNIKFGSGEFRRYFAAVEGLHTPG